MDWATVAGLGGISLALIGTLVAFLILVNRCYNLGQDALESRSAQLDAEHFRREAEGQRDDEKAGRVKAEGERDDAQAMIKKLQGDLDNERAARVAVLKEHVDAATGDDLVRVSADVLRGSSKPSGGAATSGAGGGGQGPAPVPGR